SDRARCLFHDAHPGRAMGGVDVAGAELDGAAGPGVAGPSPLNGGGCVSGRHSFRPGVMMAARMFLSGLLARTVVLRRTLLDADLADKYQALELFVGLGASSTRLRADVVRIEA